MLDKLRVEERESGKLVLVEVHHEELVRRGEVGALGGELLVEVAHVLAVALETRAEDGEDYSHTDVHHHQLERNWSGLRKGRFIFVNQLSLVYARTKDYR